MSIRGVRQLTNLTLRYCDLGGSSRGVRDFIQYDLVKFAAANPACEVETVIKRNSHPALFASYVRGWSKQVTLANMSPVQVEDEFMRFRNSSGRKMTRLKVPVKTVTPSHQGVWSPSVPLQRIDFELEHTRAV